MSVLIFNCCSQVFIVNINHRFSRHLSRHLLRMKFSSLRYEINVPGLLTGHGVVSHAFKGKMLMKAIPEDFDKSTFDSRNLSGPDGSYYTTSPQGMGKLIPIEDQDVVENYIRDDGAQVKGHPELDIIYQVTRIQIFGFYQLS